ncbi:c-Myc-binding protein isoform X1 [Ixodes scapularis]|uniref:c-Myc-binding protein isoform X1 n=1 Tax=Ixodes scapularis TaxID=6945 RepID=UPI001161A22A|nr:c-Myc-binding protein isoform X1 [Ixodes scapularis]
MTSYRTPNTPVDSKKEEFRKYLEKSGLFDALTKALVNLFDKPERPENAVAYLKACLDADGPEEDAATLKRQLDETIKKLEALQLEHDELRSQLLNEKLAKGEVEEAVEPEQ